MDEKSRNIEQWLKDVPAPTEKPGFKPEQMLACAKCSRKNPPTRFNCFYCGQQLTEQSGDDRKESAPAEAVQIEAKSMEPREKGFNVVFVPDATGLNADAVAVARILNADVQELKMILAGEKAMPIARAGSAAEAELVKNKLSEQGLRVFVLSDAEMAVGTSTRRLRGLEFVDGGVVFQLFGGEELAASWADINLLVSGNLFERKVASSEKYSKKSDAKQVTDTSETSMDEPVLDIYSRADTIGFRVFTKGFDFSCLGAQKGLLAVDNIKKLAQVILEKAPRAKLDSNYLRSRAQLNRVWANEQRLASTNMQRQGMGKFQLDKGTIMDNNLQFTKYSRMQWHVLKER